MCVVGDETNAECVVIIGSYAPSLTVFRGALIKTLIERGYRVFALAPEIDEPIRAQLIALGATPRSIRLSRASLNPLHALLLARELRSALREIGPHVVIAYTIKPIAFGAWASRQAGARHFVALITGLGYAFTGRMDNWRKLVSRAAAWALYRAALAKAGSIIFQNEDDCRAFARLRLTPPGARTLVVAGSGVELDRFRPAPLPSEPAFLMIARLLVNKGVREYADAALRLKREFPQIRVMLAGFLDGSADAIAAKELDGMIAGGVEYLGRLYDVRPAIAQASVYVLPSYREGTPRSVLEAMAMGRPIVTTDAPGCRGTVEENVNGILVPPRDPSALYRAMRRFAVEPGLAARFGRASRARAEKHFDVHRVNAAMLGHIGLAGGKA